MTLSFGVMIRSLNVDIQGEVQGAEKDRFLEIFHPLRSTMESPMFCISIQSEANPLTPTGMTRVNNMVPSSLNPDWLPWLAYPGVGLNELENWPSVELCSRRTFDTPESELSMVTLSTSFPWESINNRLSPPLFILNVPTLFSATIA